MTTQPLFQEDPMLDRCEASVVELREGGLVLDRTVFFAAGGGQPGDIGIIRTDNGARTIAVTDTVRADDGTIVHLISEIEAANIPQPGTPVEAVLDWDRRWAHMRVHTLLHLLCASVQAPVSGGQIAAGRGRLDFDLPEPPDKEAIAEKLTQFIEADAPVVPQWVDAAQLLARPDLVRTMSVRPPDTGGLVRLVGIEGIDLQACGGTHVPRTGLIGPVTVRKIEKKGRQNRRVTVELANAPA